MKSVPPREVVKEQHHQLQDRSKTSLIVVDEILHAGQSGTRFWGDTVKGRLQKPKKRSRQQAQKTPYKPVNPRKHCGKGHPHGQGCPAGNASCFKFNRRGHYSSQCLSKSVGAASLAESRLDSAFLGVVDTTLPQKMVSCCSAQAPASGVQTGDWCRSYCHIGTGLQDTAPSQATESIECPVWANPAEIKRTEAVHGTAVSGREKIL